MNSSLQGPDVNDFANKVEIFKFMGFDKIQQSFSLTPLRAQMNIGNPHCTVLFYQKEQFKTN